MEIEQFKKLQKEFDDKYIVTLGAKVSKKEITLEYGKKASKTFHVNMVLSICL